MALLIACKHKGGTGVPLPSNTGDLIQRGMKLSMIYTHRLCGAPKFRRGLTIDDR